MPMQDMGSEAREVLARWRTGAIALERAHVAVGAVIDAAEAEVDGKRKALAKAKADGEKALAAVRAKWRQKMQDLEKTEGAKLRNVSNLLDELMGKVARVKDTIS